MNNVYKIPEQNLENFLSHISRIEKKCRKWNFPFECKQITDSYEEVSIDEDETELIHFIHFEVNGKVKHNGYTLIAEIESAPEGVITRQRVTDCLPNDFDKDNFHCDHCNSTRMRRFIYVLKDDNGNFIRVGKSCLKEFTCGLSAESVASYFSIIAELDEYTDTIKLDHHIEYFNVIDILTIAYSEIENYGYNNDPNDILNNTKEFVRNMYRAHTNSSYGLDEVTFNKMKSRLSDLDPFKKINEVVEVIKYANDKFKSLEGEYFATLLSLLESKYCRSKDIGILCSLFITVRKCKRIDEREKQKESDAIESNYVGDIGEKIQFNGHVKFITVVDSIYGSSRLYEIRDDHCNIFKWFYSGSNVINDGRYEITGTVKNHSEYQGVKETQLVRCKLKQL